MALDPSIALAVRPPQFDLSLQQTPFQQYGQVLSLQNLMQQQQLGQINLEQARLAAQERKNLMDYFQGLTAPAAAIAPGTTPGIAPGTVPAAAGGAGAGAPTAQAGGPLFPGSAGGMDYTRIMQLAPTIGPAFVESHAKALKANLDSITAQYDLYQKQAGQVASLTQGIIDEPTKISAIATAYNRGLINAPTRDHLLTLPYNDPQFGAYQQQALNADQYLTQQRATLDQINKQLEENRKAALFPAQMTEATTKAQQGLLTTADMQRSQDASALYAAWARGPQAYQTALSALPADRQAPFLGVANQQDLLMRALKPQEAVTAAETRRARDLTAITEAARLGIETRKFEAQYGAGTPEFWVQQLYNNPDSVKDIPKELLANVGQQFKTKYGLPLPNALSGQALEQETASKTTLDAIQYIRQAIQNPEIAGNIGPIMGRLGDIQQATGSAIGLSPQAAAQAQELRSRMRYLLASEVGALTSRFSPTIMKSLQESSPRTNMDIDMLKGALNGVEGAATSKLDNLDRQRFGGQMRPRESRGIPGVVPQAVRDALSKQTPGYHKLSDGSWWMVGADGSISPASEPPKQ